MTLPYKYRGVVMVAALVVLLPVAAWRFALAGSFATWRDCRRLEKRLEQVAPTVSDSDMSVRCAVTTSDLILSGALLDTVRRYAAPELCITGYLPVTTSQQDGIEIRTAQLMLTGSFHELLQSVQALEEHLPECRLRSLQWQTVVQHRTRKPQLVLTLYIQQLTLKSDIQ